MDNRLIYAPADADSAERFMAECFRLARDGNDISVTVGGTGSGRETVTDETSLEAKAGAGLDIAVSLERLSGIVEISPSDMLIRAKGGTPVAHVAASAGEHGLRFPCYDDPLDDRMSVAGLLMEGPVLVGAEEHGGLREYVLSVELVTGEGQKVRFGSRSVKDVAGYEVIGMLIGSRGRFGIITEVTLRLVPDRAVREGPSGALKKNKLPVDEKLEEWTERVRKVFDPAGILG
jgi:FAD/FMN-containing dehydrogenase